jgi:signal transduction histidine kinase
MANRLPLPPLLEALDAWQHERRASDREAVADALLGLAAATDLAGMSLAVDAPPLAELAVGCGSLAAATADGGHPLYTPDEVLLGYLRTDPAEGRGPDTAAGAVAAAVAAVRARARAERAEANLAALDVAVAGIAGVLELRHVLQEIVDRVRELVDAQYAALAILDDEWRVERFVTSGLTEDEYRRIGPLPQGLGLLGLIVRENRTFRIPDIMTDPRRHGFPPNHPPMQSFLGVPVAIKGVSVGRLYLTNKRGASEFSEDDQLLVERFALHAGIAIENARLYQAVQRLAVIEERERLGRDLHDGIIQRIYGVSLSLDDVPELVEEASPEAAERVDRAIDALHETIGELRTFIYGLEPAPEQRASLMDELEALAAEVRQSVPIAITVGGERIPPLPGDAATELLSIAREALSNIARHAEAREASVTLSKGHEGVVLEVSDSGRGFDPSVMPPGDHRGLRNMRERAARLGGTLTVESAIGAGTRIIVVVPQRTARGGGGPPR